MSAAREACVRWRAESPDAQLSSAERCRRNGWTAGTRLIGDEGWGPSVIEITAIGRESILAIAISHGDKAFAPYESSWTLEMRDWQRVDGAPSSPVLDLGGHQ